jgi:hypothetical protein
VTVKDLAVMGATLVDGGVNPITGERVIDAAHCKRVLAALATSGLYEFAHRLIDLLRRRRRALHDGKQPIEDMQRHLRGEPERFECLAGWKYFYLDWNLQLWRCHNWDQPLCNIRDFDGSQRVRDGCTACMIDCYRDDSVMQHIGVAVSDGLRAAVRGNVRQAWKHWADRRNVLSAREAIRTVNAWLRTSPHIPAAEADGAMADPRREPAHAKSRL